MQKRGPEIEADNERATMDTRAAEVQCSAQRFYEKDIDRSSTAPTDGTTSKFGAPVMGLAHEPQKEVQTESPLKNMEALAPTLTGPPYTIFTTRQLNFIIAMCAFSAFFSPLSGAVYYPALNSLASDLNVSISLINLTITSYMVFQAIAPTIFGDFADQAGRRPAYIISFALYLAANIGLALQKSYVALVLLRCLQSGGRSATVAIGMGVIADLTTSSERGTYLGLVTAGVMLGPAVGPVIGGILSQFLGWRSIFWFLTIGTGAFLVPYIILVPETCRTIVGNGTISPQRWNLSLVNYLQLRKQAKIDNVSISAEEIPRRTDVAVANHKPLRWPNPFKSLVLVFEKDTAMLLFYIGITYTSFMVVGASTPTLFTEIYGLNDLQIGLCYLPLAVCSCVSSLATGRLLDWNYRRLAHQLAFPIDTKRGDDLASFPIERARIVIVLPLLYTGLATLLAYGWALEYDVPLAGALVLQGVLGFCLGGSFGALNSLVVDLYPASSSTATAGNNLVRCLMGALGVGVWEAMVGGMRRGWCFTVWAGACLVASPVLWLLARDGVRWRGEKKERRERRGVEKAVGEAPMEA